MQKHLINLDIRIYRSKLVKQMFNLLHLTKKHCSENLKVGRTIDPGSSKKMELIKINMKLFFHMEKIIV